MSIEEAADNWNLPLAAIEEAIDYCEIHQELLKIEAEEEHYRADMREQFLGYCSHERPLQLVPLRG